MTTTNELIKPEGLNPVAIFSGEGLDPILAKIHHEAKSLVPDLTTAKGRKEIASMANKVARSKTLLDGLGKDLVAGRKAEIKKVDEERKRMRDNLDALKVDVRQPLTAWEDAETARVDGLASRIEAIVALTIAFDASGAPHSLLQLNDNLSTLEAMTIGADFEEFQAQAFAARDEAIVTLKGIITAKAEQAAKDAEIERLRKEAAEREQQAREERIAREAKEVAEREAQARIDAERRAREDAERATRDAEARAQQQAIDAKAAEQAAKEEAERRAIAAEQRIKQEAEAAAQRERERIEQQQRQAQAERAAREADQKHKASINNAALIALIEVAGLSEDQARNTVVAIAKRQIPAISINY